ncbi:MAG: capsular biosynthesis protein [Alphaproteobacteria bacterium]|nr:capsular biosynthesis protein [Alphaproteobacteria bacterium]
MSRGNAVHRINLNLGDRLFWRLPATDFRGRFDDWPAFIGDLLTTRGVTDLVLLGDRRPYHAAAIAAAQQRGVAVFVTDLGYVRPGWLTLELDGNTSRSRFPRTPDAIRALAEEFPEPDFARRFHTPFWRLAAHDIAYNAAAVAGRTIYPHYRRHGLYHPFAEYASWIANAPRRTAERRATAAARAAFAAQPGSYFLFPLQLATDFQMRAESPFASAVEALQAVLASFAASDTSRQLLVIGHPLDEGLTDWRGLIRHSGLGKRATFLGGGIPDALLAGAAGVVTVNSTTGLSALRLGVPVKPLGNAIYDIPGLTHLGNLADFWRAPQPPDPALTRAFLRALVGATQVAGGYYGGAAQAAAAPVFAERLDRGVYKLPARSVLSCAATPFAAEEEWPGIPHSI